VSTLLRIGKVLYNPLVRSRSSKSNRARVGLWLLGLAAGACLAQQAPAGLAATKALIHRAPTTPIGQQLEAERDAIIDCMHTEDFRIAVKKFLSKGK